MSAATPEPEIRPIDSHAEFLAALEVRVRVFVDEQGGPLTDEPDAWDPDAQHFVVLARGKVVGTARVYFPEPGIGKIGRVALLPEYRSLGWGARLLACTLDFVRSQGLGAAVLDAQVAALPFYERLGFRAEGEPFMDAGIPHQRMRLGLQE